jgi:protein TonB
MKRLLISSLIALGIHGLLLSLDLSMINFFSSVSSKPKPVTISLLALKPQRPKKISYPQRASKSKMNPAESIRKAPKKIPVRTLEPEAVKKTVKPSTISSLPKPKSRKKAFKPKTSLKRLTKKERRYPVEKAPQVKPVEKPLIKSEPVKPVIYPVESVQDPQNVLENKDQRFDQESLHKDDEPSENVTDRDVSTRTAAKTEQSASAAVQMARPLYLTNSVPKYPRLARKNGYEGTVVLEVLVDEKGNVDDLILLQSSGHTILDKAAISSVKKWLFEPGAIGRKKVKMWVKLPVRFKLN